jgi:tRNA(Ile)-lysidine synthase
MQTLQTNFKALIPAESTVTLGLSGGPDSVFLLHQLIILQKSHNFQLIAAHLDHEWHSESYQAREFCAQLCANLQATFITKTISQLKFKPKQTGSQEDLGRQYRRYFFEQLALEYRPAKIWLAHHLDDQIETFILRLIRGASLTGLTGIKTQAGLYIHPLLQLTKLDILNYLEINNISYFIDPTNSSLDYLRNKIRQTVLPTLYQSDPRFQQNFQRSLTKLQASEQFIAQHTANIYQQIITPKYQLNLTKFNLLESYLQTRVLLHWLCQSGVKFTLTEKFLAEILRFLRHPNATSSHQLGTWLISKKAGFAQISNN